MVDNLRTGSILLPTGVFLIFMKTGACHHFSPQGMTRRSFLQGTACGFGSLALSALTAQEMSVTGSAHFAARAKRVITLHDGRVVEDTATGLVHANGQPHTLDLVEP